MNKNPLIKIIIFTHILLTYNILSQDFNLFNPSNELYLFSAYDEGANGFRYNPAMLGLKHRFNATFNAFISKIYGRVRNSELDFAINAGNFAIAYRNAYETSSTYSIIYPDSSKVFLYNGNEFDLNTISIGFGIGNKTFSVGLLMDYMLSTGITSPASFWESNPRFRYAIGFLYRPNRFISASFIYRTKESFTVFYKLSEKYTLGGAIRPTGSDRITLMIDYSVTPYDVPNFFKYNSIKAGLDLKIADGINFLGSYTRINSSIKNEFISAGINIDFSHGSIKINNVLNNSRSVKANDPHILFEKENVYNLQSVKPFSYLGTNFSLSYNSEKKQSIIPEPKKVVEITLSGSLQDFHTEDVFFGLLGKGKRSVHEVIADIDYAADDPSVKGILLKIYPISSGRFEINAAIEELTAALERFKKKGKFITAYLPQDTRAGEYYIATFANKIVMPAESLFFYGLSIEIFNYKQFLEKYGIDLQNFYAGDYKLVFQGVLDSTTEHGKEVINRILDAVYEKMMSRVSKSRNLVIDDYLRDKLSKPLTGKEAERLGLVDKNGWYEDAKNISENNTNTDNITRRLNRSEWDNEWGTEEQIAIIGVYGTIKPGESEPPANVILPIPYIGGGRSTGSETVVRQLEDAFANSKVKVIILRVDSGGGSALASAEINEAIIRLKRKYKKPLIVSMGNAAASGGYYVSISADKIFSDDLTITGSIGVWASRPNLDSLVKGQKIKVEIFKRGENSDIGSFFRKLDEEDVEIIQGIIDFYYGRFIDAIVEGRKISRQEAEEIAQGRIWMGSDAFNKKLVDEIGGLYQAVIYAKKISGIDKRHKIVYYAVPGGSTINEIVSKSISEYIQSSLLDMLGFDEEEQGLEIKY